MGGYSRYLHEIVEMPDKNILVNVFRYKKPEEGPIMPIHWHDCLEVIYVLEGEIRLLCGDSDYMAGRGNVLVVNHNEYHGYDCTAAPLDLYCIVIDFSVLKGRFFDSCEEKYIQPMTRNEVIFKKIIENDLEAGYFIEQIAREFFGKEPGYELAIKGYLYNLLLRLIRFYTDKVMTSDESRTRSRNFSRMNKVLAYISQNYMDEVSLDDMARMTEISKCYFCKLFKKLNGKTLSEYIKYVRINEAYLLLKGTGMSVTDVALAVGYNDINYFSRVFKSFMGTSPSSVRKKEE